MKMYADHRSTKHLIIVYITIQKPDGIHDTIYLNRNRHKDEQLMEAEKLEMLRKSVRMSGCKVAGCQDVT